MDLDVKSSSGFLQSTNGYSFKIPFMDMAKGAKPTKAKTTFLGALLARNVKMVLKEKAVELRITRRDQELTSLKELGVTHGTASRVLKGDGCGLDLLEKVADALREDAWKLLHPSWRSADAEAPPELAPTVVPLSEIRSSDSLKEMPRILKARRITK